MAIGHGWHVGTDSRHANLDRFNQTDQAGCDICCLKTVSNCIGLTRDIPVQEALLVLSWSSKLVNNAMISSARLGTKGTAVLLKGYLDRT